MEGEGEEGNVENVHHNTEEEAKEAVKEELDEEQEEEPESTERLLEDGNFQFETFTSVA